MNNTSDFSSVVSIAREGAEQVDKPDADLLLRLCSAIDQMWGIINKPSEWAGGVDSPKSISSAPQLQVEISNMIRRYGKESGITVYQAIGALEMAKDEMVCKLKAARDDGF